MDGGLFNPAIPRHYWDRRYGFYLFEDFLGGYQGLLSTTLGGTSSGVVAWAVGTALPTNWIGASRMRTGTTTTGFTYVGSTSLMPLGIGIANTETRVQIQALSDATETFYYRAGFIDVSNAESTDAVSFRYTHSVNVGKLECYTRNNSVETVVDSGITVAANTDYILRIEINAAGTSAAFYINSALVATITTNIPTGTTRHVGAGQHISKSAGTTDRLVAVDYMLIESIYTSARG